VPEARNAGEGCWRRHHDVADTDHDTWRSRRGKTSWFTVWPSSSRVSSTRVTSIALPFQLVSIYGEALKATEARVEELKSKKN
jgi:hypothetical protein